MGAHDSMASPAHPVHRRVVYSALFGRYENLREQPVALASTVPFIMFTDDPELRSSTWDIRVVKPAVAGDAVRSARSLKITQDPSLDEFDESLWIDNRVRLRTDPSRLLDTWLAAADVCMFEHSFREKLIDEFSAVIEGGYDFPARVYEQLAHYVETSSDLLESKPLWTGMIARRRTEHVDRAMGDWWAEVARYSRRDQLSAPILYRALAPHLAVLPSESNHSSVFHEWPPITTGLGRTPVSLSDPAAVKPVILHLREAELARRELDSRIETHADEVLEWERKVKYRDDAIRHLQGAVDDVRTDAEHRALIARDSVIGARAEVATLSNQLHKLQSRHVEVSAGFANALDLLDTSKDRIKAQRRTIKLLRRQLGEARELNRALQQSVQEGRARGEAMHGRIAWKVARALRFPRRLFRPGEIR